MHKRMVNSNKTVMPWDIFGDREETDTALFVRRMFNKHHNSVMASDGGTKVDIDPATGAAHVRTTLIFDVLGLYVVVEEDIDREKLEALDDSYLVKLTSSSINLANDSQLQEVRINGNREHSFVEQYVRLCVQVQSDMKRHSLDAWPHY